MNLSPPFNTFKIEKKAGEYKDFGNPTETNYPLAGITYPVDYGDIEGYVTEDGANLDLFVGSGNLCGFFRVYRPELVNGEHKFYINVSEKEELAVLQEFKPVIIEQDRFESVEIMKSFIEKFRQND